MAIGWTTLLHEKFCTKKCKLQTQKIVMFKGTKFESKCKWTQYPPDQAPSHGTQYVSSPYWHSKPRHDHIYTGGYVVTVGKVMGIYTVLLLFNKLWGQHNISKIWSWKYKWYKALFVFRQEWRWYLGLKKRSIFLAAGVNPHPKQRIFQW